MKTLLHRHARHFERETNVRACFLFDFQIGGGVKTGENLKCCLERIRVSFLGLPPLSRKKRLNRWFVDVVWDVEVCRYNIMPCMRQKKGEGLPAALKKKKKKPEISSTFLSPSAVVMFGVVSS